MHGDLPKYDTLLVVSDTALFEKEGKTYGFGPVVKELEAMLDLFKQITWIGFKRQDQHSNDSFLPVPSEKIEVVFLDPVGGTTVRDKLSVVKKYPFMWNVIDSEIKKHTYIHCRAPSNPAFIAMQLSKKYPKKQFWFKYAGTWVEGAPWFYSLQRRLLKKTSANCIVTVNGDWKQQSSRILSFENPCLTKKDRETGKENVKNRQYAQSKKYCFVGGLNENKGILLLLQALEKIESDLFSELHIVGDGPLMELVRSKTLELNHKIVLHGALTRKQVFAVYKECHFIILPSKSEGFPKVIGEAMNFGCIPIVSNISCINQYVVDETNGFLIEPSTVKTIKKAIQRSCLVSEEKFNDIISLNFNLAEKFTYSHYMERIQNDIFKNL